MAHWSYLVFGIFFFIVMNTILEYSKSAKSINVEMLIFIGKHCVLLKPYEVERFIKTIWDRGNWDLAALLCSILRHSTSSFGKDLLNVKRQ